MRTSISKRIIGLCVISIVFFLFSSRVHSQIISAYKAESNYYEKINSSVTNMVKTQSSIEYNKNESFVNNIEVPTVSTKEVMYIEEQNKELNQFNYYNVDSNEKNLIKDQSVYGMTTPSIDDAQIYKIDNAYTAYSNDFIEEFAPFKKEYDYAVVDNLSIPSESTWDERTQERFERAFSHMERIRGLAYGWEQNIESDPTIFAECAVLNLSRIKQITVRMLKVNIDTYSCEIVEQRNVNPGEVVIIPYTGVDYPAEPRQFRIKCEILPLSGPPCSENQFIMYLGWRDHDTPEEWFESSDPGSTRESGIRYRSFHLPIEDPELPDEFLTPYGKILYNLVNGKTSVGDYAVTISTVEIKEEHHERHHGASGTYDDDLAKARHVYCTAWNHSIDQDVSLILYKQIGYHFNDRTGEREPHLIPVENITIPPRQMEMISYHVEEGCMTYKFYCIASYGVPRVVNSGISLSMGYNWCKPSWCDSRGTGSTRIDDEDPISEPVMREATEAVRMEVRAGIINLPYVGAIGGHIDGNITRITIPEDVSWRYGITSVSFPKSTYGYTTADCGDEDAIVRLFPGESITATEISEILDSSYLGTSIILAACISGIYSYPDFFYIQVTYTYLD